MHMIASGRFRHKKILLVEPDAKRSNDRTWCFWEREAGLFEPIVHRKWNQLLMSGEGWEVHADILPYHYKMIRGIDFYTHCMQVIGAQPNITIFRARVDQIFHTRKATGVVIGPRAYTAGFLFNSVPLRQPQMKKRSYWLWQHFKGWIIETPADAFDPATARLMDFRTGQEEGTSFCYVLPLSSRAALVEYTLFSARLLEDEAYEAALHDYIRRRLGIDNYTIADTEKGKIPMTNARFPGRVNNCLHIGTAGGQTKGSSGYTFRFIQKQSAAIVDALLRGALPAGGGGARYRFYDAVLLDILHHGTLPGHRIFEDLFRKNDTREVLAFLDNETSLPQELKIISTLPFRPFLQAAVHQLT